MASLTSDGSMMQRVAIDANGHGSDAGRLGHRGHLFHLSVARLAFHTRVHVFAVRPVHSDGKHVNAHPRNGLA